MESLRSILAPCIDNYDVGEDESAHWPNNMISRQALISEDGLISRQGASPKRPISLEEVELCRRVASQAKEVVGDLEVGMGSEGGDPFHPFWLVAPQGEEIAISINEPLIRARFGDTLFPPVTMTIEPLEEEGHWWQDVLEWFPEENEVGYEERPHYDEERNQYYAIWQALIAWFKDQKEFTQTAFVCIGDTSALWKLDKKYFPAGTELTPCVLPRLILGLTRKGSLCGLFGFSVQT